jgi:RsmE family RNA methyltransferase
VNVILLEEEDFVDSQTVRIAGTRYSHACDTLGVQIGDELRVGRVGGQMGSGWVLKTSAHDVVLRVTLEDDPPAKLPVIVILALPRPKRMRRILRTIAELGVPELILLNAYRVEKSYWQTPILSEARVREYLVEGLQQSRDTVLPRIVQKRLFKPFVEDELAAIVSGRRGFVAHPGTGEASPSRLEEPAVLAIGPEGGFLPYEVGKFCEAGFVPIDLGERILTVEIALTVALARLFF